MISTLQFYKQPPAFIFASRRLLCRQCMQAQTQTIRRLHSGAEIDGRNRLSSFWTPTRESSAAADEDDAHSLLVRGGFLWQAHSGIFHLLPLGLRVQQKLEKLADKHMKLLGASKLALSSISSEKLWTKSGRLGNIAEVLRVKDRRNSGLLLSPTHEEEITTLAADTVKSYKELPIRLYQISRKYRDELRPRYGLLRAKEFLMKDLYTFDRTNDLALETYQAVSRAYCAFFDELKIPYLVAEASSGTMGGSLSHEYHFVSKNGEDRVCICNGCGHTFNEEVVEKKPINSARKIPVEEAKVWRGVSTDRSTLICAYLSGRESEINIQAVKSAVPSLDSTVTKNGYAKWMSNISSPQTQPVDPNKTGKVIHLFDNAIAGTEVPDSLEYKHYPTIKFTHDPKTGAPLHLTRISSGDECPRCDDGRLEVKRAIEVGHTFHLGTRYSSLLNASVMTPLQDRNSQTKEHSRGLSPDRKRTILQMGCHGLGVSRMIGAVASLLATTKSLRWPRVIAPFEVAILVGKIDSDQRPCTEIYDRLCQMSNKGDAGLDVVLDDRIPLDMRWKLAEAHRIGYPVVVIVGKAWNAHRLVEVTCLRTQKSVNVDMVDVRATVEDMLADM